MPCERTLVSSAFTRSLDSGTVFSSEIVYLWIRFGRTTPPQNRRLKISISNSRQQVDDLVGELSSKTN